MVNRDWEQAALSAGIDEWHRGRLADPELASAEVPDLTVIPGFSLEDACYNCIGRQSPAQTRQGYWKSLVGLFWLAVATVVVVFFIAHGSHLAYIGLVAIVIGVFAALRDAEAAWSGDVSQADGDIWTEIESDGDGGRDYYLHLGELRLELTRAAYFALVPGGPYRIYYLRTRNRVVGGQVLPGWRPISHEVEEKRPWWRRINARIEL
jgi:hypothetical protein